MAVDSRLDAHDGELRLTRSLEEFVAGPVGRCLVSEHFAVWCPTSTLCGTSFWGRPGESELRPILELFDVAKRPGMRPPIDAVMDGRGCEGVDPIAYELLFDLIRRRWRELPGLLNRQAVLLPSGLLGATMAGFYVVAPLPYSHRIVGSVAEATAWLGVPNGAALSERIEGLVSDLRGTPSFALALRAAIERNVRDATLATTAAELRVSVRTLQRRLDELGTSFRRERVLARVRAATQLLANTDLKIDAVARLVGAGSASHLAHLVRRWTGLGPREHRHGQRTAPRES